MYTEGNINIKPKRPKANATMGTLAAASNPAAGRSATATVVAALCATLNNAVYLVR